ncbi:MAG: hypothetical protein HUU10_14700 [Bacteroidetes bacterium]|nr:hypothetical protein [Bacteroidota bacterium]
MKSLSKLILLISCACFINCSESRIYSYGDITSKLIIKKDWNSWNLINRLNDLSIIQLYYENNDSNFVYIMDSIFTLNKDVEFYDKLLRSSRLNLKLLGIFGYKYFGFNNTKPIKMECGDLEILCKRNDEVSEGYCLYSLEYFIRDINYDHQNKRFIFDEIVIKEGEWLPE